MVREPKSRRLAKWGLSVFLLAAVSKSEAPAQTLILEDLLQGSSSGIRSGGSFVSGGWQVTNQYDAIYWHIPTLTTGAVEWDIRGLFSDESRPALNDKTELFHMYDHTFGNADTSYNGYRDNPYKHFVRKIGSVGGTTDALELLWQISPNHEEPDTAVLSWNPNTTYHFREQWEPDGAGNSVLRTYRDDMLLRTMSVLGTWNLAGLSVRIGAANPPGTRGAPIDAIYSNLRVWDLSANVPPAQPDQIHVFDFATGIEGWTLETWKSGAYNPGTAAWDSIGGNPHGSIKTTGSGATNNMDYQTREGGTLTKAISLEDYGGLVVEYDVKVSQDTPPGASGTGSGNLLEGSPEDKLVVYYSLDGTDGPWTVAHILSENLNQLPGNRAHRAIDLSNVLGAINNPNFALRFAWQFNTSIDTGWLDNVRLSGIALTPSGDYNRNGVVDAPDYVLWRNTLGQTGTGLAADGNGSNQIDPDDYNVWRAHFGRIVSSGSGTSANAAVPEPAIAMLFIVGILAMCSRRRGHCPKLNRL